MSVVVEGGGGEGEEVVVVVVATALTGVIFCVGVVMGMEAGGPLAVVVVVVVGTGEVGYIRRAAPRQLVEQATMVRASP